MNSRRPIVTAFTLVEILVVTALIGVLTGVGVVTVTGVRENARQTRLQNDVTVLNNGIDAYRAAGGVIPANATAEDVLAKLKTVADPNTSTSFGPPGPFIDPRLQIESQSAEEGSASAPRADYPNTAGYFYVRQGGAPGIKDFVRGQASPVVTETRQGSMPYDPSGEFLAAYADRTPSVPSAAVAPQAVAGEDDASRAGRDLAKFPRPVLEVKYYGEASFVPFAGGSLQLSKYPLDVRISSPVVSTSAQLRVARDGAALAATTNPYLFVGLDIANYPTSKPLFLSQVASLSSGSFTNSDPLLVTFGVIPEQVQPVFPVADDIPATLTYLQAGGPMIIGGVTTSNARPPVTVSLSNVDKVPTRYLSLLRGQLTADYTQRYTGTVSRVTNTNFSPAGGFQPGVVPINVQGFGSATRIALDAWVQSDNSNILISGDALQKTISIATTPLSVDILPLKPIGLPPIVTVTIAGDYPVGVRRLYTRTTGSSGAAPLNPQEGGTNIASAIFTTNGVVTGTPVATYTVVAQATGPAGTEHWFTCSPVNRTYIAITTVPLKYIGLNMRIADINGTVRGSIYLQAPPGGNTAVSILNAGAAILGNVYAPGTPAVILPAGVTNGGKKVLNRGESVSASTDAGIEPERIGGKEYTTDGVLAIPQQDLRKIVDLYGDDKPQSYDVQINNGASIDGKLYRRADPPPVSSAKPGLPSGIALSNTAVTVTGTNVLAAGSYAVTMNNTNSVLQLGSPGTITSYVFGAGSTWTGGRVEILGPVQIYFNYDPINISGVIFGNSNSIYQTGFVVMSSNSVSIDRGSAVYGQWEARDSTLTIGSGGGQTVSGSLYGSAFANKISVAGSGYVDVSGGSDTNSVTPGPSPTPTPLPSPSPTPISRPSPLPSPTP